MPSLVCVYLPRMCSLYCQLHSLLTYMDRFDVVYLHLSLSHVSLHVMYRYVTLIWLYSSSMTNCHVRSRCCCASYHAPYVSLWWPVWLHWTWDTLCCPHTFMYTRSPVPFSWHSMDMWYMCGLYWTLLLGQVTHDRWCQCLLVLSGGTMLQWCWLGCCQERNWWE